MIYSVQGTIVLLSEDIICVEQNGIAWEIHISKNSYVYYTGLHTKAVPQVKVYTYLHANDKGIALYGFHSLAERSVFLTLLKVDGIGPKAAIKILSHSTPDFLIASIQSQDTKNLAKIPGIGAKKASKILLALEGVYIAVDKAGTKDKQGEPTLHSQEYNALASIEKDVVNGLAKMGYKLDAVVQTLMQYKTEQNIDETASIIDEAKLMRYIITALEQ